MVNEGDEERKAFWPGFSDDEDWPPEPTEPPDPIGRDVPTQGAFQASVDAGEPDYAIVALAIGKWVGQQKLSAPPPQWVEWAVAECASLYEQSQHALGPMIGKYARERDKRTEDRLAKVADIMADVEVRRTAGFEKKPSARAAIHYVLDIPLSDTENREAYKLQVLWRRDRRHQIVQANQRLASKLRERGWLKRYPPLV